MNLYEKVIMPKEAPIAFRIDAEVKTALQRAAVADRRSLSSLVDKILVEWLRLNGYLKTDS
jgi:uncharacterized protein (DUF1778 family)